MADTSSTGAASSASTDGKRGDIGRQTYDDVRRLIDKGMNKTEAFAQVARESGRSAATVTTTYYRMAKRQPDGGGVRKTARTAARSAKRTATTQTDRVVQDARVAIDNLHRHIEQLEAQIEDLTARSRELDKIKRTLDRI